MSSATWPLVKNDDDSEEMCLFLPPYGKLAKIASSYHAQNSIVQNSIEEQISTTKRSLENC